MTEQKYPLMRKAVAVWLISNTSLTFKQIGNFCGFHELEIRGMADDDIGKGIQEVNPVVSGQLTREEIKRCEEDPGATLQICNDETLNLTQEKKKAKYVPIARRADKPSAIYFLVKYHPELSDVVIRKLIGTTTTMVQSIRDRSYWNLAGTTPKDPVTLGICTQSQLNQALEECRNNLDPTAETDDATSNDQQPAE